MSNISIPNTAVAGTLVKAAEYNANLNEVATKFNSYAVQTDVAKTITVAHTMSAGLIVSGGTLAAGAVTASTVTTSGTVQAPTVIGTSATALTTNQATLGILGGGTDTQFKNSANNTTNLTIADAGLVTVRNALTVTGGGLTVSAGGASVTGNSTVTGNLNVTGAITGGAFGNTVAQGTDLTTTSVTPGNSSLTIAIGANQTWRIDLALGVACASTGGILLTLTVPASATGRLTYMGATASTTTLVADTTTAITAGLGFVLYAGHGAVKMSLYLATAGSAGSVTLQTSAGTVGQLCTLYTGSTLLASRIS